MWLALRSGGAHGARRELLVLRRCEPAETTIQAREGRKELLCCDVLNEILFDFLVRIATLFANRTAIMTVSTVNSAPNTTEGRTSNIASTFRACEITWHQKRSSHARVRTERTPECDANTR